MLMSVQRPMETVLNYATILLVRSPVAVMMDTNCLVMEEVVWTSMSVLQTLTIANKIASTTLEALIALAMLAINSNQIRDPALVKITVLSLN